MIRIATQADTPKLLAMALRFVEEEKVGQRFHSTPESIAALLALVLHAGIVFVDEGPHANDCAVWYDALERQPVVASDCTCDRPMHGFFGMVVQQHLLSGHIFGDHVAWWVNPEHRKTRAAYRLLRAAEDWATTRGCSMIKLAAPAGTAVGAFYERRGYAAVETAYTKALTGG